MDVPHDIASEIDRLVQEEPPAADFRDEPVHAKRYVSLLRNQRRHGTGATIRESFGPAFEFPDAIASPADVVVVEDERLLQRNFRGWVPPDIAAEAGVDNNASLAVARRLGLIAYASDWSLSD